MHPIVPCAFVATCWQEANIYSTGHLRIRPSAINPESTNNCLYSVTLPGSTSTVSTVQSILYNMKPELQTCYFYKGVREVLHKQQHFSNKHIRLTHQPPSHQSLTLKEKEKQIDSETIQEEIAAQWRSSTHTLDVIRLHYSTFLINDWVQSIHTSPVN